jgi:hypothetical protein
MISMRSHLSSPSEASTFAWPNENSKGDCGVQMSSVRRKVHAIAPGIVISAAQGAVSNALCHAAIVRANVSKK